MAVEYEICRLAKVLHAEINTGKPVKVLLKYKQSKQVLDILEDRNIVGLEFIKPMCYKVSVKANDICCVKTQNLKAKNIIQYANAVLPSISGVLILSTSKGIMAHDRAMEHNIGGKVIMGAF